VLGTAFFAADDGLAGTELWKSDGTAAGTVLVQDIQPGIEPSNPAELMFVGKALFFSATDIRTGRELWRISPEALGVRSTYLPLLQR
jgi:ELWxxDGT repeat protein